MAGDEGGLKRQGGSMAHFSRGERRFRSGFVALIGRPNVGKSTLLNRLVGQKVAIVSEKPQTTRHRILGVVHQPDAQLVLIDTPGIHKPRHRLGEYMVQAARRALEEVEAVAFMVEATSPDPGPGDRYIADELTAVEAPVFLAVNKIDEVETDDRQAVVDAYRSQLDLGVEGAFGISALYGQNVAQLIQELIGVMPEGPRYFDPEQVTDQPEHHIIGELIREQVLVHTREEVPHSVAVVVDRIEERDDQDLIDVDATVFVERKSQRGILIGKGGRMLKQIGQDARGQIEALLGSQIYLDLWVKVRKKWRNRPADLRDLGFDDE